MDKNENTIPNGQAPNGTDPQGQEPNNTPNGQAPNGTTPTLADLQAQITELRSENAKHRKKNRDQEEAAQVAEQNRLREQGQFKELAEKHQLRVLELEPVQSRFDELSQLVAGQINAQIKNWPAEVLTFDPGSDAPVEKRLEWLEKSKPLIEKLANQARAQTPGNRPNPQPSQQPGDPRATIEQKMRASGKYSA